MCHHEIGQYDLERRRDATSDEIEADEHGAGIGSEAAEESDSDEPTVAPGDD
jgi:hypothetical protein